MQKIVFGLVRVLLIFYCFIGNILMTGCRGYLIEDSANNKFPFLFFSLSPFRSRKHEYNTRFWNDSKHVL